MLEVQKIVQVDLAKLHNCEYCKSELTYVAELFVISLPFVLAIYDILIV